MKCTCTTPEQEITCRKDCDRETAKSKFICTCQNQEERSICGQLENDLCDYGKQHVPQHIQEDAERLYPRNLKVQTVSVHPFMQNMIDVNEPLRSAYIAGATRSAWVSVDKPPEEDADVICKDEDNYRCHCVYTQGYYTQVGTDEPIIPTHWQYIPQ